MLMYSCKIRAKMMEDGASVKEKAMKIKGDVNAKNSSEINNMIIHSIEAKLHILRDI
jgi:hypothetical protein